MKPTKMRNMQIYQADIATRSKQVSGTLSDDLRKKYGRRSARIVEGDTVRVLRGEYKNVDGKVSNVSTYSGRIAIEGIKKEKGKGDKFDVMIHASNVVITSLNTSDGWRISKLEGKSKKEAKEAKPEKEEQVKDEAKEPKSKKSKKPSKKESKSEDMEAKEPAKDDTDEPASKVQEPVKDEAEPASGDEEIQEPVKEKAKEPDSQEAKS